jgi:excisionase family DNA binding protein
MITTTHANDDQSNVEAVVPPAADEVCLADAAKLLPSHRPGRHVHLSTLYRWIESGRLPAVRRGRWFFVRRRDLAALSKPVGKAKPSRAKKARSSNWSAEVARRAGF